MEGAIMILYAVVITIVVGAWNIPKARGHRWRRVHEEAESRGLLQVYRT